MLPGCKTPSTNHLLYYLFLYSLEASLATVMAMAVQEDCGYGKRSTNVQIILECNYYNSYCRRIMTGGWLLAWVAPGLMTATSITTRFLLRFALIAGGHLNSNSKPENNIKQNQKEKKQKRL